MTDDDVKVLLFLAALAAVAVWSIVLLAPRPEERTLDALIERLRELPVGTALIDERGLAYKKEAEDRWRGVQPGSVGLTNEGMSLQGVQGIYQPGEEVEIWPLHDGSTSASPQR